MVKKIALGGVAVVLLLMTLLGGVAAVAAAERILPSGQTSGPVAAAETPTPTPAQGAWVGVSLADITDRLVQRYKLTVTSGVVVVGVVRGSPAATAGIKVGDVITAVNDKAVTKASEVVQAVKALKPGDTVTLAITRGSDKLTITVTTGTAPTPVPRDGLGLLGRGKALLGLPMIPELRDLLQNLPREDIFSHYKGTTFRLTDRNGQPMTIAVIPGTVTAVSPTSITIRPNDTGASGGPYTVDGNTVIMAGRRGTISDIQVDDKVLIVVVNNATRASAVIKVGAVQGGRTFTVPFRGQFRFDFRMPKIPLPHWQQTPSTPTPKGTGA